ncbi:MAG: fumarylacetoacetate hydrolase family protein [Weeksellaceae bacterium]
MKIICIGRNYAKHAKELGNEVPDEPVIFIKPSTSLNLEDEFYMPTWSENIHYELELVIRIEQTGKNISLENAPKYYDKITLGIDFTARDLQMQLKSKGLPWEKAKAFDKSAYLNSLIPFNKLKNQNEITFELKKNGESVQLGNSKHMLFNTNELIVNASKYFTLEKGDLLYTGTPAGVGSVKSGDILTGILEDKTLFDLKIK